MSKPIFTLLMLLSLVAAPAARAAEADHPQELLLLMHLIDQSPSKTQLEAAGAGSTGDALVAIARDASLAPYPRLRAAGALGLFEGPALEAALTALAGDEAIEAREVRIQALAALGFVDAARARALAIELAAHADPELRAAALRNLGRVGGRLARATLLRRAELEPVAWIRATARRELERLTPP